MFANMKKSVFMINTRIKISNNFLFVKLKSMLFSKKGRIIGCRNNDIYLIILFSLSLSVTTSIQIFFFFYYYNIYYLHNFLQIDNNYY